MEAGFIPAGGQLGGGMLPPAAVVAPPANVVRAPGLKRGKQEEAISDRVSFFILFLRISGFFRISGNILQFYKPWGCFKLLIYGGKAPIRMGQYGGETFALLVQSTWPSHSYDIIMVMVTSL